MKMRELLITIPVHKDRLSHLLSRPSAVLQMFFCRPSAAPQPSFRCFSVVPQPPLRCPSVVSLAVLCYPLVVSPPAISRSSCRPLLSFSRLSTYLQPFLMSPLCHLFAVLQSSPPLFILLSALSGQCSPTRGRRADIQKPLGDRLRCAEGCMGPKGSVTHPCASCGICSCCR